MTDQHVFPIHAETKMTTRKSLSLVSWILISLVFILGAALGYLGYLGWQTFQELQIKADQNQYDMQQLRREVDDQSQVFPGLMTDVTQLKKAAESQQVIQQSLEEQQRNASLQLNDMIRRFDQFTSAEKNDWLLSEMEHLIKLADQHLELTYDVEGAMRLLARSAELSQSIDELGMLQVRQAILNDTHRLASVEKIDAEGIFLELGTLTDQISRLGLPITQLTAIKAAHAVTAKGHNPVQVVQAGWQASFHEAWSQLMTLFSERLVRVRKVNEPIQPLLPPDQRMYLEQNLTLLLAQAQLSVLRRESNHYQMSLQQAQNWIRHYFDSGQALTRDMLATLARLQKINIHPELPHLTDSMNAVQAFKQVWLETRKQRQLQVEALHAPPPQSPELPNQSVRSIK